MNLLIIGSGGREHSLAWALARSSSKPRIFCLPGNPGMAGIGTLLPGSASDAELVATVVREKAIDLVLVGPEAPLVDGLADALTAEGVRVFGPTAAAAAIEGSKVFAKDLMRRYGVPTAAFEIVGSPKSALDLVSQLAYPHVVKADGLAAGKGALIVHDKEEAREAIETLMIKRKFGDAGSRVIFEEFLEGEEMSVFAIAAGEQYRLLPPSQDYKRALDGDRGPNTGGMGSIAPVAGWNATLEERVRCEVIEPTLSALVREGRPYAGLLYAGLMVKDGRPKVVEFNCRFGDPETQALVPILQGDLWDVLWAAADPEGSPGGLPQIGHDGRSCACVVIASGGYPESVRKGFAIRGVAQARELPDTFVFQAGTADRDGRLVTHGGRVLSVVGVGPSLPAALGRAYEGASLIEFEGAFYRRDIGWRGMKALGRNTEITREN
jgi:phosphoribosylamine--glycine ligase